MCAPCDRSQVPLTPAPLQPRPHSGCDVTCKACRVRKNQVQFLASSAHVNLTGDEAEKSPLSSANRKCRDLANNVFFSFFFYSFIIIGSASKIATKLNLKYSILEFYNLKALKKD